MLREKCKAEQADEQDCKQWCEEGEQGPCRDCKEGQQGEVCPKDEVDCFSMDAGVAAI